MQPRTEYIIKRIGQAIVGISVINMVILNTMDLTNTWYAWYPVDHTQLYSTTDQTVTVFLFGALILAWVERREEKRAEADDDQ